MSKKGLIYVMDMESSLGDALARRVIDMNPHLIYRRWDMPIDPAQEIATYREQLRGIIISGSSKNINSSKVLPPSIPSEFFEVGVPILGVCYGHQLLGHLTGQKIVRCWDKPEGAEGTKATKKKDKGEQGPTKLTLTEEGKASKLFAGLGDTFEVWMKHTWMVESLPENWKLTASTEKCPIAAMEIGHIYAVQFHPEPYNSLFGRVILHNFMKNVCGLDTSYF
jgi:GMP synthase (glutamine-hydrolysing)